ncbi:MAG: NAD(P)/FAD-dependent oxidoreductase [Bacilli bacterium]
MFICKNRHCSKIKNRYYYPSSNQAISVRDALLLESKLIEVKVINDFLVEEIVKEDKFVVNPNSESLYFDKIILCTGSKAMPLSGSDGMGYDLAQAFGHSLIKPCQD